MLYFAYGSNMDAARIRARCPSAAVRCKAKLLGYKLAFTRFSDNNDCGAADVVQARRRVVWGVVFEINDDERRGLERAEGYSPAREQNAYAPIQVQVYQDGDITRALDVTTYVVCNKEDEHQRPSRKYLGYLISGARDAKLPAKYRKLIAEVETLP